MNCTEQNEKTMAAFTFYSSNIYRNFDFFAGVEKNQTALYLRILLRKKCPKFFDSVVDIKSSPSFNCNGKVIHISEYTTPPFSLQE